MKFIIIISLITLSIFTYAAEKTICQDGIGGQLIIEYNKNSSLGHTVNGRVLNGRVHVQTYNTFYNPCFIFSTCIDSEISYPGYVREDGSIYIDATNARSSVTYKALWKNGGLELLMHDHPIWSYQNCWDE